VSLTCPLGNLQKPSLTKAKEDEQKQKHNKVEGVRQSINKCFKGDTWERGGDHSKQEYRERGREREIDFL